VTREPATGEQAAWAAPVDIGSAEVGRPVRLSGTPPWLAVTSTGTGVTVLVGESTTTIGLAPARPC
jgi:hypothetical protein